MRINCPVCEKFTFELFKEEVDDNSNISLDEYGYCTNCKFKYDKVNLENKTYDEQVKDYKRKGIKETSKKKEICETCKFIQYFNYYDTEIVSCEVSGEKTHEKDEACEDWVANNEVELTDDEKSDIAGDIEAHRKMVED